VFDNSWQLLTAEEQQAFSLAVFRGSERETAELRVGVSLRLLTASWIRRSCWDHGGVNDMHELIGEYACESCAKSGYEDAICARLADTSCSCRKR
jgi:hypothetical protein